MIRQTTIILCLLTVMLTACQMERQRVGGLCTGMHGRQVQMLNHLMEATDNYDTMPDDSLARAVLYYMERHGTPGELQQAWRMMAKMYRRHGALMYEGFAYEMAADCVDSLGEDFDAHALAEICYEWSWNQQFCFDDGLARQTARRGMALARQAGDTLLYYRCMGREANVALTENIEVSFLPTAYRAFSELWQRGRKDWAVDAFIPYMAYLVNYDRKSFDEVIDSLGDIKAYLNGPMGVAPILSYKDATVPDSMTMWMQRYERFTHEDLEHVGSYAAIQYWELRGDYHLRRGDFDSAHYYYMKLDHPWNYVHLQGYERLINLYNKFPDRDPGYELRAKFDSKYVEGYMDVKKDRFLENEDEYRQRNVLINHELKLERERSVLVSGLLLLLGLIGFAVYHLYRLRREHREALEQNREYADMLHSLRSQTKPGILDSDIARRFHRLSSEDSHPTADDWQELRSEIDRQHPQLFVTLQQQYAEHQPDLTLSEQVNRPERGLRSLSEQELHVVSLIVIKCSPLQMSVLMVCTKSNVSNLRRRLFCKLTGKDGSGADLDKYINEMISE